MITHAPSSTQEAVDFVTQRLRSKSPFQIIGSGGRFASGDIDTVSGGRLNGVLFFNPEDMVIGVEGGMPVSQLKAIVAEKNMELKIEPYSPDTTVASAVSMADNGAGRLFGGGMRDQVIGVEYINGHGKLVRGGGKVVKNVAGYDVPKMMIGSQGGLGFITKVNFKILPVASISKTAIVQFNDASFCDILTKINTQFIPISHLRVLYDNKTYTVAVGYSGNRARIERLEKDLTNCAGDGITFIDDADVATLERYLPDTSTHSAGACAKKWGSRDSLALHVFSNTNFLCSTGMWDYFSNMNCRILCHPFGGDIHLFDPTTDTAEQQSVVEEILRIFPEAVKCFVFHSPAHKFPYQTFSKLPDHLTFSKTLKKILDPSGIFHSAFYTLL